MPRTMDCGVITNGVCGPRPIDNSLPQGVDCNATEPSAWGPNGEVTGVRLLYPVAIPRCAQGSDCTYVSSRYPNGCPKAYGCGVSANGDCGSGGLTQNQQQRIVGIDDKVSKLRDKFTKKIEQINKNIDKYKI